jgi:hypothetical protein
MGRYSFEISAEEPAAPTDVLMRALEGSGEFANVAVAGGRPVVVADVDAETPGDARALVVQVIYDRVPPTVRGWFETEAGTLRLTRVDT